MLLFLGLWFTAWAILFLQIENTITFSIMSILYFMFSGLILKFIYKQTFTRIILSLFIISIPLSFKNILGGSYSDLPLSYYNIFYFSLVCIIILKNLHSKKLKFNLISILAIIGVIYIFIPTIMSDNFFNGLKELIDYLLFFFILIIWSQVVDTKENIKLYLNLYIFTTLGVSIAVIYQALMLKQGVFLGNTVIYGGNRYASGYIFNDYSFLALYLITPVFLIVNNEMKKWIKALCIVILMVGSFMTSARTGIAALFIVLIIFMFVYFLKNISKQPIKVFLSGILVLLVSIFTLIAMNNIRSEGFFASSGREEGYMVALKEWIQSPLVGIGFDLSDYIAKYNTTIPHNIFVELLLSGGIVFLFLIIALNLNIFKEIHSINSMYVWTLLTIYAGAQFIPNITSSRFLIVLICLFLIHVSPRHREMS